MKKSLDDNDWDTLYQAVHKIIPSFAIMGINKDFEDMAKKVQEYANKQEHLDEVQAMVLQLGDVCSQACDELKLASNLIKKTKG
jgi:hypothetical protein